jgi:hypothetical protein
LRLLPGLFAGILPALLAGLAALRIVLVRFALIFAAMPAPGGERGNQQVPISFRACDITALRRLSVVRREKRDLCLPQ